MRKHLLIIDDEECILDLFSDYLNDYDCAMCTAENADKALALIREFHFDYIISDYTLPNMNGVDLIKIAQGIQGVSTKYILISGRIDVEQEAKCIDVRFVSKPLNFERILSLLDLPLK